MNTKLELQNQLITQFKLKQAIIEADGEITEEIELALKSNDLSLRETVDNLADTLDYLEEDLEQLSKIRKKLLARSNHLQLIVERIKDSVRSGMKLSGSKKISGHYRSFSLCKPTTSVDWDDSKEIPKLFQRVTIALDRELVKEALKTAVPEEVEQMTQRGLIMLTKESLRRLGVAGIKELQP